jgi:hypothetical protein
VGDGTLTDPRLSTHFACAVCGIETNQHASWLLVAENRWLDRLKILSWHPLLAGQNDLLCVCGKQHLKTLITHWLTEANLELQGNGHRVVPITSESQTEAELGPLSVGRLVGELSVHRESFSHAWTGSAETLECILNALVGGVEPRKSAVNFSVFDVSSDCYREFAQI